MSDEIVRSSKAIIEWWLAFSYRREKGKIVPQKFITNNKEREVVGAFLQTRSSEINDENYKKLREAVYNQGIISGCKILDENDGHDPLTYFSMSYICSIFWLLEDLPVNIDNSSNGIVNQNFLKEIRPISEGLIENNSRKVIKGVLGLYKITEHLDKPKLIIEAEKSKFNFEEFGKFQDKNSEFKDFLLNCWNTKYHQLDVYNLFDPENNNSSKFLDIIVDNIYYYLYNNDCEYIVGIERGGIPFASLVAYKFNIQCHILRTVPLLKVLPKLPSNNRILLFDDVVITGATINQAKKYLKEKYNPYIIFTVSLAGKNGSNEFNKQFIDIKNYKKISLSLKNLKVIGEKSKNQRDADLKELLKKRCINESRNWHSEFTYTQDLFYKVCDWFIEEISKTNNEFVIIATSIYGLPYASVVSYKLKKPLYLFSRRSNYKHDFKAMSLENLQNKIDYGLQNVVLIDDIYHTGITNKLISDKLEKLGINKKNIQSYVVADFSDTKKPISCLNKKMINE